MESKHIWQAVKFKMLLPLASIQLLSLNPVNAQLHVVPDRSVGNNLNSEIRLTADNGSYLVVGGTESLDGQQLFHSFQSFNVAKNASVYFTSSPNVEAILTRVVGNNPSKILGILGTKGTTADLFLLNPNGIYFGPNARLDLRGSFFASTAGAITTRSGEQFSAIAPQSTPLLRLNLASGLQYGQPLGELRNAGDLQVDPGQSLTLLGGRLEQRGRLAAPGGEIRLLGDRLFLLDQAAVDVSGDRAVVAASDGGRVWIGGGLRGGGDVPLARQVVVGPDVRVLADGVGTGSGGEVIVWSEAQTQFWGEVSARGGALGGDGGFVEVSSAGDLRFGGQADTQAPGGQVGTLLLDPTNIEVVGNNFVFTGLADVDEFADGDVAPGGSQISANTIRNANSNVVLQATEGIRFNTDVEIRRAGVGLTAQAGQRIEVNGSLTTGKGGDLVLIAGDAGNGPVPEQGEIVIEPGGRKAFLRTDSGDMRLIAGDAVQIDNAELSTFAFSSGGGGSSGNLFIDAPQVNIGPQGVVTTNAFIPGDAGNIVVNAQNVQLDGGALLSQLLHPEQATPGSITISAETLSLRNGAGLDTTTIGANFFGAGPAGKISLTTTGAVEVLNSAIVADSVLSDGGDITIAAGSLRGEAAEITSAVLGQAAPGNIAITTQGDIALDQGSFVLALTLGAGDDSRGRISVITQNGGSVSLNNGSGLFSIANGAGDTGDITLDLDGDLVMNNNSQVSSAGPIGDVEIDGRSLQLDNGSAVSATTFNLTGVSLSQLFPGAEVLPDDGFAFPAGILSDLENSPSLSNSERSGELTIRMNEAVTVRNGSALTTAGLQQASGGDLNTTAQTLNLDQRSVITSLGQGGSAGNINLTLLNALTLNQGVVNTSSEEGSGGNIAIASPDVLLDDNSAITSSVFDSTGGGGAINIQADRFVLIGDSDILANAEAGPGGSVRINSETFLQGLFDQGRVEAIGRNPGSFAAFRSNGRNDISADSATGTDGTVDFPQVQPERRTSVPIEPVLASEDSIDRSCTVRPRSQIFEQSATQPAEQSAKQPGEQSETQPEALMKQPKQNAVNPPEERFIVSGRGGIPLNPQEALSFPQRPSAWIALPSRAALSNTAPFIAPPAPPKPLVPEASGWQQNSDGRIQLVSSTPFSRGRSFVADCSKPVPPKPAEGKSAALINPL